MTQPESSKRGPYVRDCEAGTYAWCACGKSSKQPYCDGSHAGSGIVPKIEEVPEAKKVAWCGCRQSKNGAFCDGSHSKMSG